MTKKIKEKAPKISGSVVYKLLNQSGEVIYIGKTDGYFKTRIGQHFKQVYGTDIHKIEVVYCLSSVESLLLEAHFIGKYKPPYNKIMKGDSRVTVNNESVFEWVVVWSDGVSLLPHIVSNTNKAVERVEPTKSVRSQLKGLKLKSV